jgi:hypothetical protein
MSYLSVAFLLWGIIATERAIYYKGEWKLKECDYCERIS